MVILGVVLIALNVLAVDSFFLQLAGFIVLIFGVLKLVEITTIGQKPSAQRL